MLISEQTSQLRRTEYAGGLAAKHSTVTKLGHGATTKRAIDDDFDASSRALGSAKKKQSIPTVVGRGIGRGNNFKGGAEVTRQYFSIS